MEGRGIVDVAHAQGAGDAVDTRVVHLLEGDDVRVLKVVILLEQLDRAVDLAGKLDVEGDDTKGGIGVGPGKTALVAGPHGSA